MKNVVNNEIVLKVALRAIVLALLAFLILLVICSVTSCSTSTSLTISADSLRMDNPNITLRDSTSFQVPLK